MALKHIAIILDGNRRFAKKIMANPVKGHEYGAKKVEDLINLLPKYEIKELTLYCLSIENLKNRPKNELEYLLNIFRHEFKNLDMNNIEKNKIKINFIGNLSILPEDLQELCRNLEIKTKNYDQFTINFAIAYGGRQEITEAVRKIISKNIKEVNENTITDNLYLKNEPELIIRTGGEKRTSNFLPWQSVYSEWIFLDKMWPEFTEQDLIDSIKEFENRKRNFGK
jgi:tritrans,polycis-undecaprenyl-diphosphate synthase [geranylgeranyl-diphosphate specific]